MNHLVIHCGGPKTGSSALQYTLHTHPEALRDAGYEYPSLRKEIDPARGITGNAPMIARMWPDPVIGPDGSNLRRKRGAVLRKRIRAIPPERTVILSSEYFSGLEQGHWRKTLQFLEVTGRQISAVTYFRNQVDQLQSSLGQRIMRGMRRDPERHVENGIAERRNLAVYAHYERLRRLPFAAVVVAAYDRGQLVGGQITADFFHRVGKFTGQPATAIVDAPEVNTSLSGHGLALKNALNGAELSDEENGLVLDVVRAIPELRRQGRREILLRDDLVALIERHFAADNEKAVETFGDEFAVLLRPRPQDAVYVDVMAPPPAEAVDLFWARWHAMRAAATADAAAAMVALEPRLRAALRDAASIGRAAA